MACLVPGPLASFEGNTPRQTRVPRTPVAETTRGSTDWRKALPRRPGPVTSPWSPLLTVASFRFIHMRSLKVWSPLGGRGPSTRQPSAPSDGLEMRFALESTWMVTWAFTASFHSPPPSLPLFYLATSTLYLPLVLALSLLHQGALGPHTSAPLGRRPGVRTAGGLPVIFQPSQDCHVGLRRVCTAQRHCLQGSLFTP